METAIVKVEYKDHTKIVLTNKYGDTYTSQSEELMDFFCNANEDISILQPKWIPVIKDELLPAGYYYLKLYQPDTKIEDIITFRITGVAGKITYHFATDYCRLPEPPNH